MWPRSQGTTTRVLTFSSRSRRFVYSLWQRQRNTVCRGILWAAQPPWCSLAPQHFRLDTVDGHGEEFDASEPAGPAEDDGMSAKESESEGGDWSVKGASRKRGLRSKGTPASAAIKVKTKNG